MCEIRNGWLTFLNFSGELFVSVRIEKIVAITKTIDGKHFSLHVEGFQTEQITSPQYDFICKALKI